MSLLGTQVFANPTTAIWGQGGGGGGSSNFQTLNITQGGNLNIGSSVNSGTNLNFYKDVSGTLQSQFSMAYIPDLGQPSNLHLYLSDQTGDAMDTLAVGDLIAYGTGNSVYSATEALSIGTDGGALGIRLIDPNTGSNLGTFATFAPNAMDLSNVSSINGVPYFNAPGTNFQYTNWSNVPLAEDPDWSVLNSLSFTPPVNGKVYVETLGQFVATTAGGTAVMSLSINGTDLTEVPSLTQAYDSNINFTNTYLYQFPVTAGVVYDISSIAKCSALPPAGADVLTNASRMFLMFSPN